MKDQDFEQEVIEEFEKVWRISVDILNDDGAGSWGKWAIAQKEITGFLLSKLKLQHERDIEWFKGLIPEKELHCKCPKNSDGNTDHFEGCDMEIEGFNKCREQVLEGLNKEV